MQFQPTLWGDLNVGALVSRVYVQAMSNCSPHCSHHPILRGMWVLTLERREHTGSVTPSEKYQVTLFFLFFPSSEAYPAGLASAFLFSNPEVIRKKS